MLLIVDFMIVIFINKHLQSNCEYIVNSVNIQYTNSNKKKSINYVSIRLFCICILNNNVKPRSFSSISFLFQNEKRPIFFLLII